MGNLPLLILDLTCQQKRLLAQQGRPLLRWGRPVPFTLQLGLQEGLTLEQYSKGSHTPTSAQPLGAHP
jgi:hypothetical protein